MTNTYQLDHVLEDSYRAETVRDTVVAYSNELNRNTPDQ